MNRIYKTYYDSPIGYLEIQGTEQEILSITFVEQKCENEEIPLLMECCNQIDEYFRGIRKEFTINLILKGTEFQRKVWNELIKIPFGDTLTYKGIAQLVGNINAVRAVGSANSKNTLSIIVPCHRVIGSDRALRGYAGGIWRKEWLINHEKNLKLSSRETGYQSY